MIKANELRIGNLLSYPKWYKNTTDKTWYVRDIYFEDNKIGLTDGQYQTITKLDYLEPIPLTEEILLKVGFEKKSFYVVGAGSCLKWELADFTLLKNLDDNFYMPTMPKNIVLESLHKLQNVYYYMNNCQELNTAGLI